MPVTTHVRSANEKHKLFVDARNERDTSHFSYCWQTMHPGPGGRGVQGRDRPQVVVRPEVGSVSPGALARR